MLSAAAVEPIPLSTNADGAIRIAGTRITLTKVIDTFMTGASPEKIAQNFLRHREEVDAYFLERRARTDATRRE